jgi:hypothetical protein
MQPPIKERPSLYEKLRVLWQESPGTVIAGIASFILIITLIVFGILYALNRFKTPQFATTTQLPVQSTHLHHLRTYNHHNY